MAKNYVESYTFDATDSMKVTIPVFLDEEQLNRDDALHKLFVTFYSFSKSPRR